MFDRFSDDTRRVMGYARQAALGRDDDFIRVEHMLLGLLQVGGSRFAEQLSGQKIDAATVERALEEAESGQRVAGGLVPFCPEGRLGVEACGREADLLEQRVITPDHLAMGLLTVSQGRATRLFAKLGLRREALLDLLRATCMEQARRRPRR